MRSKELEKLAKKKGFKLIRSKGSHRIYGLVNIPGTDKVIIPASNGKDMNPLTFKAIKNQLLSY